MTASWYSEPAAGEDELVRKYVRIAYWVASRRSRGPAARHADELESAAMLGLLRGIRTYDAARGMSLRAYLFQQARFFVNRALYDLRRLPDPVPLGEAGDPPAPEGAADRWRRDCAEDWGRLTEAVAGLPGPDRELLVLMMDGVLGREAARAAGIKWTTWRERKRRAVRRLRRVLGGASG